MLIATVSSLSADCFIRENVIFHLCNFCDICNMIDDEMEMLQVYCIDEQMLQVYRIDEMEILQCWREG